MREEWRRLSYKTKEEVMKRVRKNMKLDYFE